MNKEKEKFLWNCTLFRNELADLQREIEEEENNNKGTLAYIGANYSYKLANIGFALGYATWFFEIRENGKELNFDEIKQRLCDTIISNERICGYYENSEIEKIKERILEVQIWK